MCLKLATLCSRRQHLDGIFPFIVFKQKISCHSNMDPVNLQVPTKLIRKFSIFTVSSSVRSTIPARCVSTADNIYQFRSLFDGNAVSLQDIFSMNNMLKLLFLFLFYIFLYFSCMLVFTYNGQMLLANTLKLIELNCYYYISAWNIRTLFMFSCSSSLCPFTRHSSSTANAVYKLMDNFCKCMFTFK
jgi:hypothetical protein